MAKVRLEDLYDDENEDFGAECRITRKTKNHIKDEDDISEKVKKKNKAYKIKQNRKAKISKEDEY